MVEEEEVVVVVVVSFVFKPSSLLFFVLLFVAFDASFCGNSGEDVAVVVANKEDALAVVVIVLPSLS